MFKEIIHHNENVKPNTAFLNELKKKLPNFFTQEKLDDDGIVVTESSFDLDKFIAQLRDKNINELTSGYQLDFIGKDYAKKQLGESPTTVIVPDNTFNQKAKNINSGNLFFTGDNLEVLRHLQNNFESSVDFIYIDPPYNTGNDGFVYPDSFEYSDKQLINMFGLTTEELDRLKSIQGKATHSAWMTFMYPRLFLAKKLLKDTGLFFISIDDNEQSNLKLILDEIFGEGNNKNVIAVRRGAKSVQAQFDTWDKLGQDYEYVLLYTKNDKHRFPAQFKKRNEIKESSWRSLWVGTDRPTMRYELFGIRPSTGQWLWSEERTKKAVKNYENMLKEIGGISDSDLDLKIDNWYLDLKTDIDLVRLSKTGKPERYEPATNKTLLNSNWTDLLIGKTTEVRNLFGFVPFDTPKLTAPIRRMLGFAPKDALILDFFAGSSTTADAVLQQNADDGGDRKFIMCTLPEPTYTMNSDGKEVPTKGGKAAYKAGFKSIDEISRERIIKAANNIEKNLSENEKLEFDSGFRHFRVLSPNQLTIDDIESFDTETGMFVDPSGQLTQLSESGFDDMITPFSAEALGVDGGATGEDTIITTWMVTDGYKFDVQKEEVDFKGYSANYVEKTRLYLINEGWSSVQTQELVNLIGTNQMVVQTVVLYGYSFSLESMRELEIALKQLDSKVNLVKRY